jgi:uncharacterized membrane protein
VRYSEIISIAEVNASGNQLTSEQRRKLRRKRAAERLEQMNRDRLEMIAREIDRELRRYLVSGEYERHQLADILGH